MVWPWSIQGPPLPFWTKDMWHQFGFSLWIPVDCVVSHGWLLSVPTPIYCEWNSEPINAGITTNTHLSTFKFFNDFQKLQPWLGISWTAQSHNWDQRIEKVKEKQQLWARKKSSKPTCEPVEVTGPCTVQKDTEQWQQKQRFLFTLAIPLTVVLIKMQQGLF